MPLRYIVCSNVDTYRTLTDFFGGGRGNRRQLVLSSSYLVNSGCVLEEQDPELLVGDSH
jgi:hypothetical protein